MAEQKPLKKVTRATAQEALGKIDNLIDQARNDGAPYSVDDALDVLRSYRIGPHTQYAGRGRTIVKLVIDYGPWVYSEPEEQEPYLALIDAGADVDAQDKYGLSLLHHAVDRESGAVCELLLKAGAKPDPVAVDGRTPLDYAMYDHRCRLAYQNRPMECYARCVEALILGGADVYRRYEEPIHPTLKNRESPFDWISALPEDAPQRKTFFDALAKRDALKQTSPKSQTPNA
ncbi:MAG: hypothetical protein IJO40_09485 [Thermoguttaceae bacterium]|nr:hypothetical protein [Thermoguttaceae bacterium]